MARIKQGFLGNASGKLGNLVFARWRTIETVRQYQPNVQDAKTDEQLKQRNRMLALINFLKPINKSFVRFFNYALAKGSTPWAVAIKNNMKAVSPDGDFQLEALTLGNPQYPPLKIQQAIFDPFIDQIQIHYLPVKNYSTNELYPNVVCAALGKFKSESCLHNFDTRHLLVHLPTGYFFSFCNNHFKDQAFYSYWKDGLLWFIYFDRKLNNSLLNPSENLTKPAPFKPKSFIDLFNTDVKENPVPPEAISWEYTFVEDKWYCEVTIDYDKISIEDPINYTILLWGLTFKGENYYYSGPYQWNLGSPTLTLDAGDEAFTGGGISLYAVYNNEGLQVSQFNRIFVDSGTDGRKHDIFELLFNTAYTFPASFLLSSPDCGFCGIINELFNDFIELFEEGIVKYAYDPNTTIQHTLFIMNLVNGYVEVSNYFNKDGNLYYFFVDEKATLIPVPNEGLIFSHWDGPDGFDVVQVGENTYEIVLYTNRSIFPVFIPNS